MERRQHWPIGATCARNEETKKTKKETFIGKLGIRADHPRRPIKIPFGTAQWAVVSTLYIGPSQLF